MLFISRKHRLSVPKRHRDRVIPLLCAILPMVAGHLFAADETNHGLELQVSSEKVPAGGTAQFKVWATTPHLIAKGRIVMDFDPAVFGSIVAVQAFSTAGDAIGTVFLQDRHLEVPFGSSSGGIGRSPELPVLSIAIPVLPGVAAGTTASVTVDPSQGPWLDPLSEPYEVTVKPGTVTVGGGLWILDMKPGGGVVPAGATLRIRGAGFTSETVVELQGVSIAATQFVGPEEIDLTLGAPAELTAKRVRVRNPGGSQVDYFSSLHGDLIFPLETMQAVYFLIPNSSNTRPIYVFQNQNPVPVDIILTQFALDVLQTVSTFTIPSGGAYQTSLPGQRSAGNGDIIASAPIRILGLGSSIPEYYSLEPLPGAIPTRELVVAPQSLSWDWQIGSPPPLVQYVGVSTVEEWQDFQRSDTTTSGEHWVNPGYTGLHLQKGATPTQVSISVDPSALSAGTYQGKVTFTPVGFNVKPSVVNLSLTVRPKSNAPSEVKPVAAAAKFSTAQLPALSATPASLTFGAHVGGVAPRGQSIIISPFPLIPLPLTATVSTDFGGDWLRVTIDAPLIYMDVNPIGLAAGTYHGKVTVNSANASPVEIPVTFLIWSIAPPPLKVTPAKIVIAIENGGKAADQLALNVDTGGFYYTVLNAAMDGGNWLLSGTSLRPGVHSGSFTVQVNYGLPDVLQQVVVPVTMMVGAGPNAPPVTATVAGGASQIQGSVSPGEIVTIHGLGVGPPNPAGVVIDSAGKIATNLSGLRVLFDGIPAPLLYASVSQTNVIVPYEVADRLATRIEVEYKGTRSQALGVPVAPSAPAIFTANSSGVGGAAMLNQDNSANSPLNPAARGSVIQIFATGEGLTAPAGVTGAVTHGDLKKAVLPVSLTIGGVDAQVVYQGSAPEAVAGLFQVNAVVPLDAIPGQAVPIILTVGSARSQASVTIAVK